MIMRGLHTCRNHLTSLTVNAGDDLQPQKICFADAAPLLVTSTASGKDALSRLPPAYRNKDIIRLRPNVHVDVGDAIGVFDEDGWRELTISSPDGRTNKATVCCVFGTPRRLSLNVDIATGTMLQKTASC